jgi:hypothetical protein
MTTGLVTDAEAFSVPVGPFAPPCAPILKGDERRPQVYPFLGESVFITRGTLLARVALHDALLFELVHPNAKQVRRHPGVGLDIVKSPLSRKQLLHDHDRPGVFVANS